MRIEKDPFAYKIKVCTHSDIADVMAYIDKYWAKNHILSYHKELVHWQYYNNLKQHYNFIIAKSESTQEILGVLGYIPTYKFDHALIDERFLWLSVWKVREDIKVLGLGIELLEFLINYEGANAIISIGINARVEKLYKALGFKIGVLNQFYIINKNKDKFNLVDNFDGRYDSVTLEESSNKVFQKIEKDEFRFYKIKKQ